MQHCKRTFYLQCYLSFAIILLAVYMLLKYGYTKHKPNITIQIAKEESGYGGQLPYYPQPENYQGHLLSGQKFLSVHLPQINNAGLHRNHLEEVTTLRAPDSTD